MLLRTIRLSRFRQAVTRADPRSLPRYIARRSDHHCSSKQLRLFRRCAARFSGNRSRDCRRLPAIRSLRSRYTPRPGSTGDTSGKARCDCHTLNIVFRPSIGAGQADSRSFPYSEPDDTHRSNKVANRFTAIIHGHLTLACRNQQYVVRNAATRGHNAETVIPSRTYP
jgi:hypothetical protein